MIRPMIRRGRTDSAGAARGRVQRGRVQHGATGPVGRALRAEGGEARISGSKTLQAAIALLIALAISLSCLAGPAIAFAEDDDNLVDPTQRADNSFIYDTTISSLFSQASLYEGRTVQVVGEVIGDRITASVIDGPDMYWITLTSTDEEDKSSISVLLSADQASQIDHYGKYGVTGTILQVRGTYHQACSEHEGLPDIHATNSGVMQRGVDRPDEFSADDFLPGVLAVAVGLALMGGFYFARERMR